MIEKKIMGIFMEFMAREFMNNPIWFWVSLLEAFIIIALIIRRRKNSKKLAFADISKEKIKNAQNQNIDMTDVINSINKSQVLYKELSKRCHPDLYLDDEKKKIAESIFKDISKYKRNYQKLLELRIVAIKDLNINI